MGQTPFQASPHLPLLDPADLEAVDPRTQRQGTAPFAADDPLTWTTMRDLLGGAAEAVVDPGRGP